MGGRRFRFYYLPRIYCWNRMETARNGHCLPSTVTFSIVEFISIIPNNAVAILFVKNASNFN